MDIRGLIDEDMKRARVATSYSNNKRYFFVKVNNTSWMTDASASPNFYVQYDGWSSYAKYGWSLVCQVWLVRVSSAIAASCQSWAENEAKIQAEIEA